MNGPSEATLARVQAASGLTFATFLVLHLVNTTIASTGQANYDAFQGGARAYYQWVLVELLVIGLAPLVHIWASLLRGLRRRRRRAPAAPLRTRLHRYAGYFLLVFVPGHVFAVRAPALVLGQTVDMSFVSFSMHHFPVSFTAYYGLLALAGLYHLVHGALAALRLSKVALSSAWFARDARRFWAIVSVGAALLVTGVLAIGGHLYSLDESRFDTWHATYERLLPYLPLPKAQPRP